ncbi:MAG: hypothetical protein HamCj_21530 [Candidatus Hamiltonella defensa (Ceratovacuna japonica)]
MKDTFPEAPEEAQRNKKYESIESLEKEVNERDDYRKKKVHFDEASS